MSNFALAYFKLMEMKKLLSLPPNLTNCFHDITGLDSKEWFCTNDPVGKKLGSGGGTTWLLHEAYRSENNEKSDGKSFDEWLGSEKRLLLHAGGQSRRLPAYAPSGKILTPIPVFRWERGQRLGQTLLDLQVPLYQQIMEKAPENIHTMIVSGDVLIRSTQPLQPIPEADIVCYGLWLDADIAKDHGVFISSHHSPDKMECMLQKPSLDTLAKLQQTHYYLTDIGIWLLSDRAVKLLMKKSMTGDTISADSIRNYDMYTDFGRCLGTKPTIEDEEISKLSVVILPLPGGEFYHYGTTHEVLSSTLAVQNLVADQRRIMHRSRKPHPAMFVQNSFTETSITEANSNLWIENSWVGLKWQLAKNNFITGVPENNWDITLAEGQCIDIVPIGENGYAVRPYGYDDRFRGALSDPNVTFIGKPFTEWAKERDIEINDIEGKEDLQSARIFPVVDNVHDMGLVLRWMLGHTELMGGRAIWLDSKRLSADEISAYANLKRLTEQRQMFQRENWMQLARNHEHSVFYQLDLSDAAQHYADENIMMPLPLKEEAPLMKRISDSMFRSEVLRKQNKAFDEYERNAFQLLSNGILDSVLQDKQQPKMAVCHDQIVWGRSPVRIDIAGGWTDTPPYCLIEGGAVVNLAIELNGQPPLQAYIRPSKEPHIVLRSIDLGAAEKVETYEQLAMFNRVGSPFSIPKAALALAGFLPEYSQTPYASLREQLEDFGSGIELTMFSAIPAGSGLGTSSILAATVLGALNDFCTLAWDKNEIGTRTLALEQLLTTGGGWQDQFGGLLHGVKLLRTESGFMQSPSVSWLPDTIYTQPEYHACHLLYYTGITRTAKSILSEIVRRMFLNQHEQLALLRQMKQQAEDMSDAILRNDFNLMGTLIRKTWAQNQALDSGTNPEEVARLTSMVDDLCLGYKLPGAGGGGYLYMIAKDPEAAARIKQIITASHKSENARFVDMTLSTNGLQISRS
ncbi:MAG: bifunctional fucokinase/fucose-1-phosphate guanylyltransferase [Prevotellaceae bacterium]|nr:bifunctional fucokinase/fucose-1-phosphate guanylyltransferase [Prevotellaceae bacterium]